MVSDNNGEEKDRTVSSARTIKSRVAGGVDVVVIEMSQQLGDRYRYAKIVVSTNFSQNSAFKLF